MSTASKRGALLKKVMPVAVLASDGMSWQNLWDIWGSFLRSLASLWFKGPCSEISSVTDISKGSCSLAIALHVVGNQKLVSWGLGI